MESKTFILADNQDITREGVISILHQLSKNHTIITVCTCNELQEKLKIYPDSVVIIDYTLFDYTSVNQFLNMIAGAKESSWLLFSDELSEIFLWQVLFSDQQVCIAMKLNKKEVIIEAIKAVCAREVFLCEIAKSIKEVRVLKPEKPDILTATEKMVLREIALGKMTKEIAIEKNLSFHTVNTHRRNIFRKLKVNNVHEAIKYALKAGLLNVGEYYI